MIFGPSGRVRDPPKPIISNFGYTKRLKITPDHIPNRFQTNIFGNLNIPEIEKFDLFEKMGTPLEGAYSFT